MDAFFASVEIRERPELKNIPIAIGGGKRGVISTCNYKAREFGVRSAMSTVQVKKLCPHIKFIQGHHSKYRQASQEVFAIVEKYTDLIEQVSIDEAYLDVTHSHLFGNSATLLAQKIREEIFEKTKLTASAGIAPNKLLAKIASDYNKPNGQFTVAPHQVSDFIKKIELKRIGGVGKVLDEKLKNLGFITCEDLQKLSHDDLHQICGKFGDSLYLYCRGIDYREVVTEYERKSVGVERTFLTDLNSSLEMKTELVKLITELKEDLKRYEDRKIKNIHVKIKYSDFKSTTIERSLPLEEDNFFQLFEERFSEDPRAVRLLGVGVKLFSNEVQDLDHQLALPFTLEKCV